MHFRALLVLTGLTGSWGELSAQVLPTNPAEGFLPSAALAASDMLSRCVTDLVVDHVGGFEDLGCQVVDSVRLDSTGSTWMVKYRRTASLDYESFVDTVAIDELVLMEAGRGADLRPIWHNVSIRDYVFLERVESIDHGDGLLVRYLTCLNGTGGCAEEFLFRGAQWSVVSQPFIDSLADMVPDGFRLHNGRDLNLRTFEGIQPVAGPDDANCCPSGLIRFKVELRDNAFHLVSATVGSNT